jgi:hypothetical protein
VAAIVKFIDGYKTYLVSFAILVYSVLAVTKVAPNPDDLAAWFIGVSAMAIGVRSALQKVIDAFKAAVK